MGLEAKPALTLRVGSVVRRIAQLCFAVPFPVPVSELPPSSFDYGTRACVCVWQSRGIFRGERSAIERRATRVRPEYGGGAAETGGNGGKEHSPQLNVACRVAVSMKGPVAVARHIPQ